MKSTQIVAPVIWLFVLTTGLAHGSTIPGLHNTGVADDGTLLTNGVLDPSYTLLTMPSGSGYGASTYVTLETAGTSIGPGGYFSNGPTSKWIGPLPDMNVISPPGTYVFRTTFDLTGFNPATAAISGLWSTDNAGLDILINGASTGFTNPDLPLTLSYWQFAPFTISSGFVSGINTLDFVLTNYPAGGDRNPIGLRVELSGTATVPEPSTISLGVLGVISLLRWRVGRAVRPEILLEESVSSTLAGDFP